MVPPPALTSVMSMTGMRSGWPSTWYSSVVCTSPPATMAHLAVVPPMSNEMSRSAPSACARLAQPMAPAAGPDSIVCTGLEAAAASEKAPPFDWVIRSWPPKPRPVNPFSKAPR